VKVLLDTCVWGKAKDEVSRAGHDTEWAGDWDHDPGDDEILRLAHAQKRVLVTLDKDFGELGAGDQGGQPLHDVDRRYRTSSSLWTTTVPASGTPETTTPMLRTACMSILRAPAWLPWNC